MFEGQYFDYRMKKAYAQGATLGRIAIDRLMQGEKQAATNRRQAM
jgi:hypothetical protein